jgi:ribosomal protein S18 acetylase RimI-like enzyme
LAGHALDNPAWTALNTFHAHLSRGGSLAKRYVDHIAPISSVGRRDASAFDELATLVAPGETVSMPATLEDLVPLVRDPLKVVWTKRLVQMVCTEASHVGSGFPSANLKGNRTNSDTEIQVLSEPDVPDMLALTALTQPGPFRSHTYTLGTYVGIRVNGVLAAMGGQRMHLPGYREVSAICTHPDFRGRGYARAIVARLINLIVDEGLTPFLHVQEEKHEAQSLYADLGFAQRARVPLIVVERHRS